MNFIENWGTEVAIVIALLGSLLLFWLGWPERNLDGTAKVVWRVSLGALALTSIAASMYLWLGLNGGGWL